MRVSLLICTFDRPYYLKQCLDSLQKADLSELNEIVIVDDCSTDHETIGLINDFVSVRSNSRLLQSKFNHGIKNSLISGYTWCFSNNNDLVINLDSDAIVMPDFVIQLVTLYRMGLDGSLLTGFNSTTINANGTERHKILRQNEYYYFKQSVGGINFCVDKSAYENYLKPALLSPGNFDHNACINAGGAYCLKRSVVQHIGYDSSMGHHENPDVADDFGRPIPNVTLLGFDYNNKHRLEIAKNKCTQRLAFAEVKMITDIPCYSKEQYSEWCIKELYKHFDTSHVLVFQHDGYVNNPGAWDDSWLQYDYIGAPWYYQDGMAVGNGGFSLRSKDLCKAISELATEYHPEDHHICRTYRPQLEAMGFKFAPLEVAEKFSFEGYMQPDKYLSDQFGVHGNRRNPVKKGKRYVIGQFSGLGDILFLVPLVRALMQEGNECLWPIADEYYDIHKHFPDVNMVRKSSIHINYDQMSPVDTQYGTWLPYRYASEIRGLDLRYCMRSKYELYGHDHLMWRNLYWQRDKQAEYKLAMLLKLPSKYQLVNRHYGNAKHGMQIVPDLNPDLPVVEMQTIPGFTLIDWCAVIEGASEIHTANTSLLYLLEIMPLKMPIHFYRRGLWGEQGYEHTDYLYTKDYILH